MYASPNPNEPEAYPYLRACPKWCPRERARSPQERSRSQSTPITRRWIKRRRMAADPTHPLEADEASEEEEDELDDYSEEELGSRRLMLMMRPCPAEPVDHTTPRNDALSVRAALRRATPRLRPPSPHLRASRPQLRASSSESRSFTRCGYGMRAWSRSRSRSRSDQMKKWTVYRADLRPTDTEWCLGDEIKACPNIMSHPPPDGLHISHSWLLQEGLLPAVPEHMEWVNKLTCLPGVGLSEDIDKWGPYELSCIPWTEWGPTTVSAMADTGSASAGPSAHTNEGDDVVSDAGIEASTWSVGEMGDFTGWVVGDQFIGCEVSLPDDIPSDTEWAPDGELGPGGYILVRMAGGAEDDRKRQDWCDKYFITLRQRSRETPDDPVV